MYSRVRGFSTGAQPCDRIARVMDPVVAPPPELIDVRSDERFDERRLASVAARQARGQRAAAQRCASSAAATRTSPICCTTARAASAREYVLRRPPLGPVAARRARHAARVPRALEAVAGLSARAARVSVLRRRLRDRRGLSRDGAPPRRRDPQRGSARIRRRQGSGREPQALAGRDRQRSSTSTRSIRFRSGSLRSASRRAFWRDR